ncbi:PAAR-like protein [Alphaproteobacteria bacterium endosymbiont of Tiliacea citrago]|uniref:PAAR-like protein n=1 Tax=Alphaproteobacteria bacterium endosymbiont of Tiliacea citrago TaxID=3077944 RepID=UPI00313E2D60
MAFFVTANFISRCTMGIAPTPIAVLPNMCTGLNLDSVRITDCMPIINIKPYGMCNNPLNPAVAAIIASSFGAVRQFACISPLPTPWVPPNPRVLSRNLPSITSDAKKMCYPGGVISIVPLPNKIFV